jgi:Ca2+-binding EF-hand superfamily protein
MAVVCDLGETWDQVIFYWTLVARHLARCFETSPQLRPHPTPLPDSISASDYQISLSAAQQNQIREIFELFDTDGGGFIDKKELQFAMSALGFQAEAHLKEKKTETANLLDSILSDGTVTLAEFSALMTGEVLGSNPYEELQAVFAALSMSDGESRHDNLITLGKLQACCKKFEVSIS